MEEFTRAVIIEERHNHVVSSFVSSFRTRIILFRQPACESLSFLQRRVENDRSCTPAPHRPQHRKCINLICRSIENGELLLSLFQSSSSHTARTDYCRNDSLNNRQPLLEPCLTTRNRHPRKRGTTQISHQNCKTCSGSSW